MATLMKTQKITLSIANCISYQISKIFLERQYPTTHGSRYLGRYSSRVPFPVQINAPMSEFSMHLTW